LDPRLEQAAMDLYANEFETFRRVTLPLVAPGIAGSAIVSAVVAVPLEQPKMMTDNTK
jgi:ABC-type spermidine/putrescine transport system permease subunit II